VSNAIECLRRSWHVHPCPHDTSFGLSLGLWIALAGIPEAEPARAEYEDMARLFAPHFGMPRERESLPSIARTIYRAIREDRAEHHHQRTRKRTQRR